MRKLHLIRNIRNGFPNFSPGVNVVVVRTLDCQDVELRATSQITNMLPSLIPVPSTDLFEVLILVLCSLSGMIFGAHSPGYMFGVSHLRTPCCPVASLHR